MQRGSEIDYSKIQQFNYKQLEVHTYVATQRKGIKMSSDDENNSLNTSAKSDARLIEPLSGTPTPTPNSSTANTSAGNGTASGGSGSSSQLVRRKKVMPLEHGCEDNWTWSKRHRSKEIVLSGPNNRTVHFHPNWSKGTAGVQGKRPLNNGRFYWELHVSQRVFGTSIMFGIGTKQARKHYIILSYRHFHQFKIV